MHQEDILIFFEYQRQIFGICPCCGDFFRLSDTKIYKDERKSSDWLDKLGKEEAKIQLLEEKFNKAEFTKIDGNRVIVHKEEVEDTMDIENISMNEKCERLVMALVANNECLPFKNESFDCYIANLSLMLVDNYQNMLKEALRVA
jgi:hypothetical protein